MTPRKKAFPWPKDEYVVLEEKKEVWLRGSWIRAMAKRQMNKEYGYEILLVSQDHIDKLRDQLTNSPSLLMKVGASLCQPAMHASKSRRQTLKSSFCSTTSSQWSSFSSNLLLAWAPGVVARSIKASRTTFITGFREAPSSSCSSQHRCSSSLPCRLCRW